MAGVSFDGVKKVYSSPDGDIVAVEDFDLDVDDGDFLVLVGPSGCGKSTTLRMIAGLETITDGTISIGDRVVNESEPRERDIAMVFQNYALYPHMSVRENIGFGLKYSSDLSATKIGDRVEQVAEMMGISDLLDDKPAQLSGGQRQRVALGRAIVREPQVFLFDEPLSNLDAKLRTHMRTEITRLQRDLGVTSVYVTHDQAEAMTMADVVAVMNDGNLQQAAPPNEVYEHPTNQFVAGFIGSPSMNFLEARVERHGGEFELVTRGTDPLTYRLDESTVERAGVSAGDDVTLGVRPEDIAVVHDARDSAPGRVLEMSVDVVEPMGSDNFLTLLPGQGDPWVARVDSSFYPDEESEVQFSFALEALHLFAPDGTTLKSQGTTGDAYHVEPRLLSQ
jgi:multiple sugar transport system ATP-binding protein